MARYQQTTKTRSLREDKVSVPDSMPASHRICFVALLDAFLHAGIPFYAGKWDRSGKVKLRIYTADEQLETFLDGRDNPTEWLQETATAVLSKGLVEEVLRKVAGLAAVPATERPAKA